MSGLRVGLSVPGATSAELLRLGVLADEWNVTTLWVGDPDGGAPNADDNYVTASAGGLAGGTSHVRIGMFLRLGDERQLLRIAEDVAVVDQASCGRAEIGLVPSRDEGDEWLDAAARFLRARNSWAVAGLDEVVPVLPGPLQPVLPRVVVGGGPAATALAAGRLVSAGAVSDPALVPAPTVMRTPLAADVEAWLEPDPAEQILALRCAARACGAQEVLLVADAPPAAADLKLLGTIVVPLMRAADRDVATIGADAWSWLRERTALHTPPPSGPRPGAQSH